MKAKTDVAAHDIIEPKVGTKLRMKAMNAHTRGKSTPAIMHDRKTRMPVAREIADFIDM